MIEIKNMNSAKALEFCLFKIYDSEFEVFEGLNQHKDSLNFYTWLYRKGIIDEQEHNRITDEILKERD